MKNMKFIVTILCISLLVIGCESASDYSEEVTTSDGDIVFEKNSKLVLEELAAWQNEESITTNSLPVIMKPGVPDLARLILPILNK